METSAELIAVAMMAVACLLAVIFYWMVSSRLRRIESDAHVSETRAQAILQAMPLMAWMKDADGKLLFANATYERYSGKSIEAIMGRRTREIWPHEIAAPTEEADRRAVKEGRAVTTEVTMEVPYAGIRIIHVTRVPICNDAGLPVGVVGVGEDVTDRKLADQHRKLTSSVFDSSSDGIVVADGNGRIVAANKAVQSITGFIDKELEGTLLEELHPARSREEAAARLSFAAERGSWAGETIGVRSCGATYPQRLRIDVVRNDEGDVANVVAIISDITEQRLREDAVNYLARYDQLTGLANRHYFIEWLVAALGEAEKSNDRLAVMFVDIDRFKGINDSFGHLMGDKLLQSVANRIREAVPQDCFVARMGGDEFLVGVPFAADRDFSAVAGRLNAALSKTYRVDGCDLAATSSIGVAIYPEDSSIHHELIMQADMAMYQAKSNGRNQVRHCTDDLRQRIAELNEFAFQMQAKTMEASLVVRYQPKVDMRTGELSGFEALVRWNHPEYGEVLPSRFISIAEETGGIVGVGNFVLSTVCRQLAEWGSSAKPVAINISAVQMMQADFVEKFVAAIDSFGIKRDLIEIEITESLLIADKEDAARKILQLKREGIRIALDDFGSGYSSLSYLTVLPIDVIKIDRSFVSRLASGKDNDAVIEFVIALGNQLGLAVIAEGVETRHQADYLLRAGCAIGQGWLYGKPLLGHEATAVLAEDDNVRHKPHGYAVATRWKSNHSPNRRINSATFDC